MKENYLHDKIRKQQDQLDMLNTKCENLTQDIKKIISSETMFKDCLTSTFDDYIKRLQSANVSQMEDYLHDKWQDTYKQLHGHINRELKMLMESFKNTLDKFIDEIFNQRKDISLVISVLISKKILQPIELKMLDKKMLDSMENEGFRYRIKEEFYPQIKRSNKVN